MLPVLYSFRRCPYAIRARYTLTLLDLTVELREVVLKSKPDALLALGGRTTVPQLIDVDGTRYPESLDIIFWALSNTTNDSLVEKLWSNSTRQKHKIKVWINYNDGFFKYWLDRYKYADRYPEYNEEHYRQKGEVFLSRLEKRLARSKYLLGNNMTIADVAVFPFVRQFAGVNSNWFENSEYHCLNAWLKGFVESEVFNKVVMKKLPAWSEEQSVVLFP